MSRVGADKVEAHVLTYNSEHMLDATLTYLDRLVEKVRVLDGGSTDGTLDIIKAHDVALYHVEQAPEPYNYKEDFARDILRKESKSEWTLVIDSDELFEESLIEELPLLVESDVRAWLFEMYEFLNLEKKDCVLHSDVRPRLIRSNGLSFSGERAATFLLKRQDLSKDHQGVSLAKSKRLHFHWIDLGELSNQFYPGELPPEASLLRHGQDLAYEKKSRDRFYEYDVYKKLQNANSAWTRKDERFQKTIRESIRELFMDKSRGSQILDVGCGDGYSLDIFKEMGFKKVVGMDINEAKIEETKKHGHLAYACDLKELPFSDSQFDLIFCSHTLEHCYDLGKSLAQLKRVIKPRGTMFVIVPYGNNNNESHLIKFLEENYLSSIIDKTGFKVVGREFRTRVEPEQWIECTG